MPQKSIKKAVKKAARLGEGRDKIMAHLSPGEIVLPLDFQKKFPAVETALRQAFEKSGIDYERYVAGSAQNRINPRTGAPMFDDGGGEGGGGEGGGGEGGGGEGGGGEGGGNEGGGGNEAGDGNYGGGPDGSYGGNFGGGFSGNFGGSNENGNTGNNEGGGGEGGGDPNSGDPGGGFLGGLGDFLGGLLGGKGESDPESNLDEYGRDMRDIYGPEYIGDIRGMAGYGQTVGAGRDEELDPAVDSRDKDYVALAEDEFNAGVQPGQAAFNAMMDAVVNLATRDTYTQEATADDVQTDAYNNPFTPSAELQATLAAEEAAYAASLDPTTTATSASPYGDLNLGFVAGTPGNVGVYGPEVGVNPTSDGRAEFTSYVTSPNSVVDNSYGLTAPSSDPSFLGPAYSSRDETVDPTTDSRAEFTSYVTSPDSVVSNSYGLTAPSSDFSFLGPMTEIVNFGRQEEASPYGTLDPNFTPGVIGDVGRAFSSRMAGDEREVDEKEVAPSVTTEERSEPRGLTIMGVKGNAPSTTSSATPGYDISTYGIDPYETISGAVRQGETTTGRDGTPYGGGEPDRRRPLTAEEIQYLADMGYLTNGAGASAATVNPSVAPVRYDISKFISGIGSLATSGNRT